MQSILRLSPALIYLLHLLAASLPYLCGELSDEDALCELSDENALSLFL